MKYCKPDVALKSIKTPAAFEAIIKDILAERHPQDFAVSVVRALAYNAYPTVPEDARDLLAHYRYKDPVPGSTKPFNSYQFIEAIKPFVHLIQELIGDIGMWCALDHLLNGTQTVPRDADQRFEDMCRIYESLFVAVLESRGELRSRVTIDRLLLHRWALQAAAVLKDENDEAVIIRILARTDRMRASLPGLTPRAGLEKMLRESMRYHLHFDEKGSLVLVLRELKGYGGPKDLGFPSFDNFPAPVKDLISTFVAAWQSNGNDLERVRLAMAL